MEKSIYISESPSATKSLGVHIAKVLLKQPLQKHALVISLEGELGSGKTTFSQGFARGLGVKGNVLSPTFLIVKHYKLKTKNYKLFYHIDCYRLKGPKELLELGWKKMIMNPQAIVLIEWGNRVKRILPKHALHVSFSY